MNLLFKIIIFSNVIASFVIAAEKPKLKCPKTDSDYQTCMLRNLVRFIPRAFVGIPEYNIKKLDPLDIPFVVLNKTLTEDTTIVAILKNVRFLGYSFPNIHKITITDLKALSGELLVSYPNVNLTMEHFFGGTLFSIPLGIEGTFNANFTNFRGNIKVTFKSIKKGDLVYFAIDHINYKDRIGDGRVRMIAKNPEDQPASDFINNFVNRNPRPVLDVFSNLYKETVENILRFVVDTALAKVPAEKLFA